ncbi:MAG: formyltransferase family protein, partial [Cyclobacteriaceae bacterium]
HEAVINNKEIESGITIHIIDEIYDRGSIVFQASCPVTPDDDAETLAKKIHQLEYEHYPKVIENLVSR